MTSNRIVVLPSFLSESECAELVALVEGVGFTEQYSGDGRLLRSRCQFEDSAWTNRLWERLAPHVPSLASVYSDEFPPLPTPSVGLDEYEVVGLNNRLRCYKYGPTESFRRHEDIAYEFDAQRRTFYTVLVYPNVGYSGGETAFDEVVVSPELGMLVMFPHELEHEGRAIVDGMKYTLRTDVVFAHSRSERESGNLE